LKFMLKRRIAPIVILLLISSLMIGCESAAPQQRMTYSHGVIVGHCSTQFKPITTHMTSVRSSSQAVYFISGIHLYALNAGDGRLLWCMYAARASASQLAQANATTFLFRDGPPLLPDGFTGLTVSHGVIYVNSMNGYTYAFQASSGTLLWKLDTSAATSAPVVVDNMVYVGSGTIYALNTKDGSVRWSYPTSDVVSTSPVIVNSVLYVGSYDAHVYALNAATGARLWQYDTGGRVYADPVVADGTVFFSAGDDETTLYAVNAQDGKRVWQKSMLVASSLAFSHNILYAGAEHDLYGLNSHNGAILWRHQVATPFTSLIANGVLYVASASSGMDAFDVGNGRVLWHNALNPMHAGETSRPALIEGDVYVETIDVGVDPSNVFLHAINARSGVEDWHATVSWNVSTIGVAT
jgi:outer membrane protein assembly factor BamB